MALAEPGNLDLAGRSPGPKRDARSKTSMSTLVSGSTDTTAFAGESPVLATAFPANAISTEDFAVVRLIFGGANSANKDFAYRVKLWYRHRGSDLDQVDSMVPLVAASGVATLGSLAYGASGATLGQAGNKFADTITETLNFPGSIINSPADNTIAFLEIDVRNAYGLEVELDLDGGSDAVGSMDVFYQWGEFAGGGGDVQIAGLGLATAALQTSSEAILTTMDADSSLLVGTALTFSRISLITAGAATTQLLAKTAAETQRLHGLYAAVSAAALIEIEDKDATVLATWNWAANGGMVIPFNPLPEGAIQATAVNKGLQIVNSAGNLGGYAIVSTG